MKKFFVCLLVFLLTACTSVGDVNSEINEAIEQVKNRELNLRANHNKDLYSFYLPSSIANLESSNTYNVLKMGDTKIVLNLDIASIINEEHYTNIITIDENVYDDKYMVYNEYNIFVDTYYRLSVYAYDEYYLIKLGINNVTLISCVKLPKLKDTLMNMFIIGYSSEVDKEMVVTNYSSKDVIDYTKEKVDLFEIIVPKDGRLEELINSSDYVDIEQDEEVDNLEDVDNTDDVENEETGE